MAAGGQNGDFQTFLDFEKNFNCIFENNSLKALFGQNIKKLKILKLSPDSRYLQKLALNKKCSGSSQLSMQCLSKKNKNTLPSRTL